MYHFFKILNNNQKYHLFIVALIALVLALFELAFFSLLQPIIGFFVGSDIKNLLILKYINLIDLNITHIIFIFFLIFLIRTIISIILIFKKHQLNKSVNDYLSIQLFKKYIYQNYLFFLNNNSSNFLTKIIVQVEKFSYILVDSYITMTIEIFLVVSISLFLLFNFFLETLIFVLILANFFFLFNFFIKKKMTFFGEKKILHDNKKIKNLQESFYIIQNIKLDSLENIFSKKFEVETLESSRSNLYLATISELGRPLIEFFLVMVSFLIILVFYFYFGFAKSDIISMLSIFVVGMFRILPSCNKILTCINNIRYHKSTILTIGSDLNLKYYENELEKNLEKFTFEKSIILNNINFSYSDGTKVLNNINLEIKKRQSIGIVGPSGSGKSTLLNIISNLLAPESGIIFVDNQKLSFPSKIFQSKIGYVPQKAYLFDDTLIANIILGEDENNYNYQLFHEVLKKVNLSEVVNNLPKKEKTKIGERGVRLSGGQQQRLIIARALYKKPEIIIFDEATNSLDKITESEVFDTIFSLKEEITSIIVSHDESVLKNCDIIYFLQDGELREIR